MPQTPAPAPVVYLQPGSAAFWRANLALFLGGFVTFAALYCLQPLLPTLAEEFAVGPAVASLSLSLATGTLAVCLVLAGTLSETLGRKPVMAASLLAGSVLTLLTAWSPDFSTLLALRALQGVVLAGVPAVAMAYLGEEVHPHSLGLAMGLYISGNTVGGMSGRILAGLLAGAASWRVALGAIGVLSLLCAVWFWLNLPRSANFHPRPAGRLAQRWTPLREHLRDPGLVHLYGVAFLLMGSFVAFYNYVGFHLMAPPYGLSQATVGWIFLVYLVGTFSSAWMGRLADRLGRRKVLWTGVALMGVGAMLTLAGPLPLQILGIAIFTFGFFGGHSIASSWVGRRARAHRAQAASLYLLFYYAGASVGGWMGGLFWSAQGWPGLVAMVALALALALVLSQRLTGIPPIQPASGA